jgi:hypothetical protein
MIVMRAKRDAGMPFVAVGYNRSTDQPFVASQRWRLGSRLPGATVVGVG